MSDFPAPKTMAKSLRSALADQDIFISHGQSLEVVARQLGYANWNVLSARMDASEAPAIALGMPAGWVPCGRYSGKHFRTGIDPDMRGVAVAEAIAKRGIPGDSFAGLMQSISAEAYRGKRLQLSAQLKVREAGVGTIWMRIDPVAGRRSLGFDNMMRRKSKGALSGDSDWTERAIVLDVPEEAYSIHFGFFLQAPGIVWARDFRLEAVAEDVPVTGDRDLPSGPTNLNLF
ncbi:glyoxalase superfamily protein [Pelagibacterium sp. H642]|uniref:glyoxalase superfamily protein n=1 Tax=Pelagibacterium sp. H642 TaxID=1881069 RepID=UPI0028156AF3|nr:glyoxalase superfamily protein [Pelagibacterium sp. H642]WMT91507.1 glyoxalase superfamily protein [Pelagibacterium sp. H642]